MNVQIFVTALQLHKEILIDYDRGEYEKGKFAKQKLHSQANSDSMGAGTFENNYCGSCVFFRGVDNELALRKRYKELLKIFHPDNRCGDTKTLLLIQKEYEKMKRQYYEV